MSFQTDDGWEIATRQEALDNPNPDRPRIVVPSLSQYEEMIKKIRDTRCCGRCESFLLRMGQDQLRRENVIPQAIQEYEHNIQWYGNQSQFGLCNQWDGHMTSAVGPITIPKHFLDSSIAQEDRDKPVECPAYKERGKGLRSVQHYVGKPRNWEE